MGEDFHHQFDIESDTGVDDLAYWWLQYGRSSYPGVARTIDKAILWNLHLQELNDFDIQSHVQSTALLKLISRHRPDLKEFSDAELWTWWLRWGQTEYLKNG